MTATEHPLALKYHRPRRLSGLGLTIYRDATGSLYRVLDANAQQLDVETLSVTGWIHLIRFDATDGIDSADAAIAAWLKIETPT